MERNNLDDLLGVLEQIRSQKYPDIPADVVNDIVNTQFDNQSDKDRIHGRQETTQIVMRFLNDAVLKDER